MDDMDRIRVEFDDGTIAEMSLEEFRLANDSSPELVKAACEALNRGETYRDGGGASPAFTVSKLPATNEPPDISELVEAIRDAVEAADAFNAAHPDDEYPDDETGKRWRAAFDRLRALLSDCDKAMEAFGS